VRHRGEADRVTTRAEAHARRQAAEKLAQQLARLDLIDELYAAGVGFDGAEGLRLYPPKGGRGIPPALGARARADAAGLADFARRRDAYKGGREGGVGNVGG
jgi:hypothetical protein